MLIIIASVCKSILLVLLILYAYFTYRTALLDTEGFINSHLPIIFSQDETPSSRQSSLKPDAPPTLRQLSPKPLSHQNLRELRSSFVDEPTKKWVSRFTSHLTPGANWVREQFFNRILRSSERLEKRFENLTPETYKKYKSLSGGFKLLIIEIVKVAEMATDLHYKPKYHLYKRKELEAYLELPKDIKKVAPLLCIFPLPGEFGESWVHECVLLSFCHSSSDLPLFSRSSTPSCNLSLTFSQIPVSSSTFSTFSPFSSNPSHSPYDNI